MFASWRFLLVVATALALPPAGLGPRAQEGSLDRPALEELEALLRDLGFDPGKVDGVVDTQTIDGIRQYQDFALLPGEPEPSARLLNELRGVAAAFAALNADKTEIAAPEPETPAEPPAEKVIVPPPPAPPKLIVEEAAPPPEPPAGLPAEAPAEAHAAPPAQTAALPPPTAMPQPLPTEETDTAGQEDDPAAALQARVEEELLRFRHQLQGGSLTPAALARQLNDEGRALLQQAQYDAAIVKFSTAIHLDPGFAGAWSNRGTAYQRQDQAELAKADFDKAKELGFGGFRKKDAANPLR